MIADTGSLYSSTGTLLATGTFANETASGWQTLAFATPISIVAGTTYVASYHSNGHYIANSNYFTTAKTNGPLTALAGTNGVYTYGSGNLFPSSSYDRPITGSMSSTTRGRRRRTWRPSPSTTAVLRPRWARR